MAFDEDLSLVPLEQADDQAPTLPSPPAETPAPEAPAGPPSGVSIPSAEPAPPPTPAAPKLTWDQVSSDDSFKNLQPAQQLTVLKNYTAETGAYLKSLPDADPAGIDQSLDAFQKNALSKIGPQGDTSVIHQILNAGRVAGSDVGAGVFNALSGLARSAAVNVSKPGILGSLLGVDESETGQTNRAQATQMLSDAADYWAQRAKSAPAESEVDTTLDNSTGAKIAHFISGTGTVLTEGALPEIGLPLLLSHNALQRYGEVYNETGDPQKAANAQNVSLVGNALFLGASHGIAEGLDKVLPKGAPAIQKWAVQASAATAGNVGVGQLIKAADAANQAPDGQRMSAFTNALQDVTIPDAALAAGFGIHGTIMHGKAVAAEKLNEANAKAAQYEQQGFTQSAQATREVAAQDFNNHMAELEKFHAPAETPSNQPSTTESTVNTAASDVKELGDLVQVHPGLKEGFSSLDVPTKSAVMSRVVPLISDKQVFNSVIGDVPVDVVNLLAGSKFPPEKVLQEPSVFVKALSTNSDSKVVGLAVDSLVRSAANHVTEAKSPVGVTGTLTDQALTKSAGNELQPENIPSDNKNSSPPTPVKEGEVTVPAAPNGAVGEGLNQTKENQNATEIGTKLQGSAEPNAEGATEERSASGQQDQNETVLANGERATGEELTPQQLDQAKKTIRKHYGLNRPVTDQEAHAEIGSLRRKEAKGNLDDSDERLLASLKVGKNGIAETGSGPVSQPPAIGFGSESTKTATAASSWRQHFSDAVKDTTKFPRPWKSSIEQDGRKTLVSVVDANGKSVGELPRRVGQTLDQLRAEAESLMTEANTGTQPVPETKQKSPSANRKNVVQTKQEPVSQTKEENPLDLAHTTKADLGKALDVPKGATTLRATNKKGQVATIPIKELKGANVLEGGGPYKKLEAGTIGKGREFLPMKEKIGVKEAPARAAGEEEHVDIRETKGAQELPTTERSWVDSTYEGVAQTLKAQGIDPESVSWTPDQAEKVSATVKANHETHGEGRQEYLDMARDRVQSDLLENAQERGNPFKTEPSQSTGKDNYSVNAALMNEIGNAKTKLSRREVSGTEEADLARQNATQGSLSQEKREATPAGEHPYRDVVSKAVTRRFAAFAKATDLPLDAAPGATKDQITRAARIVYDRQLQEATGHTLGIGETADLRGKPGNVNKLVEDPKFQQAVKERIAGRIAQDVRAAVPKEREPALSPVSNAIDSVIARQLQKGKSVDQVAKEHSLTPQQVEEAYDRARTGKAQTLSIEAPQASPEDKADLRRAAQQVRDGAPIAAVLHSLPEGIQGRVKNVVSTYETNKGINRALEKVVETAPKDGEGQLQRALARAFSERGANTNVVIDPTLETRKRAYGEIEPGTGKISVSPFQSENAIRWTLLHEKSHQVLYDKVEAFTSGQHHLLTESDVKHLNDLEALRQQVLSHESVPESVRTAAKGERISDRQKLFSESGAPRNHYGLIDLHEFTAEVMTNAGFQKFLNGIKARDVGITDAPRGATVWDHVKQFLRRLVFGGQRVANDSVLAQAFDRAIDLTQSGTLEDQLTTRLSEFGEPQSPLTPKQTDTAAFKNWFGESKVTNEQGEPTVVYHGTRAPENFTEFNTKDNKGFIFARNIGAHFAESPAMTDAFTTGSYARPSDFSIAYNPEESWYRDKFGNLQYGKGIETLEKEEGFQRRTVGPLLQEHGRYPQYKLGEEYGRGMIQPGGRVYPTYLKIEHPLEIESKSNYSDDSEVERTVAKIVFPKDRQFFVDSVSHSIGLSPEKAGEMWDAFKAGKSYGHYSGFENFINNYVGFIPDKSVGRARELLQQAGYDGIKYENTSNNERVVNGSNNVWIALEPNQIKSAIGNSGEFNPKSADILQSPADNFRQDQERQVNFLNGFAKEHGYKDLNEFAAKDPALFNESAKLYRGTSALPKGEAPTLMSIAANDADAQNEVDKRAESLYTNIDKITPGFDSKSVVRDALAGGATKPEDFAQAFKDAGLKPDAAEAAGKAVETHFQIAAADKAQEIAKDNVTAAAQRRDLVNTAIEKLAKNLGVVPETTLAEQAKADFQAKADEAQKLGAVSGPFSLLPKGTSYLRQLAKEIGGGKSSPFQRILRKWDGDLQQTFFRVRKIGDEINKRVPDKLAQEGITNWIQADGDGKVLQDRANATTNAKLKAGYEAALKLTPDQVKVAQHVKTFFDDYLKAGQAADLLKEGRDNYVNQIWKDPRGFAERLFGAGNKITQDFRFAKKATHDSFFAGEQAGLEPQTKEIAPLMQIYAREFGKVLATRDFIKNLTESVGSDGRALVTVAGSARKVTGEEGDTKAFLIRPRTRPSEAEDYKPVGNSAFNKWKWVSAEDGKNILLSGDLLAHPEIADHLKNVFGTSAIRQWYNSEGSALSRVPKTAVRLLDKFSGGTKDVMLSVLSPFHYVQEGTHAVGHRVNPFWGLDKLDLNDPKTLDTVRHGLVLAHDEQLSDFMEGLSGGPLSQRIPVLGKYVVKPMSDFLFKEYIPRLKLTTYNHALDRNLETFKKELANGAMDEHDVKAITADQMNAAYGHLNYAALGRNPTIRHLAQMVALAPDFLEARGRFTGQALAGLAAKGGREQLAAIAVLAAAQWLGARVLNKTLDDDYHFDHPFSVVHNGREYTMRSVPEDIYRAFKDSRQFIYGRLNPVIGRGAIQYATGHNYRGEKVGWGETTKELMTQWVPIWMRSLPGVRNLSETEKNKGTSAWESLVSSWGVQTSRYSPINQVYGLADKYKKSIGIKEDTGSYPTSKYQRMRYALEDNNVAQAQKEFDALKAAEPKTPTGKLVRGFHESLFHPFTGNQRNDKAFEKSLTNQHEKELYQMAVAKRRAVWQAFSQLKRAR